MTERIHMTRKDKERRFLRIFLLVLSAVLALVAVGLLWWSDSRRPQSRKDVSVSFTLDGAPLTNGTLSLLDTSNVPVSQWGKETVSTDQNGSITLLDLLPGEYWLVGASAAYLLPIAESTPKGGTITCSQVSGGITLTVNIKKADGSPLKDAKVTLLPFSMQYAPPQNGSTTAIASTTDWQGSVRFTSLLPGAHYLVVEGVSFPLILDPGQTKTVRHTLTLPETAASSQEELLILQKSSKPYVGSVDWVLYSLPRGSECLWRSSETDGEGRLSLGALFPGENTLRIDGRRYKVKAVTQSGQLLLS